MSLLSCTIHDKIFITIDDIHNSWSKKPASVMNNYNEYTDKHKTRISLCLVYLLTPNNNCLQGTDCETNFDYVVFLCKIQ